MLLRYPWCYNGHVPSAEVASRHSWDTLLIRQSEAHMVEAAKCLYMEMTNCAVPYTKALAAIAAHANTLVRTFVRGVFP